MIIKGKISLEIPELKQEELEDPTPSIWKECPHSLTMDCQDPESFIMKEICQICGKEIFK